MSWYVFNSQSGVLVEKGDDSTSTVTRYDPTTGAVLSTTPYTQAQITQAQQNTANLTSDSNYIAIMNAIATQRTNNTNFLALASPLTQAQLETQVRALTRQSNAMMRLWANDLTGTN